MANLEGMENKFFVMKNDYINCNAAKAMVWALSEHIEKERKELGKLNTPIYLVINTDEPYADEVIEILKKNGHWG